MTDRLRAASCIAALAATIGLGGTAGAADFIALTDRSELVTFSDARPGEATVVKVNGLGADLLGIDFRPADKKLYGLTADSNLYEIQPATGIARMIAKLSVPVAKGGPVVVDFNPVADRLRVIGPGGQSLRIVVETGAATEDKTLNFAGDDKMAGMKPMVTAGAYTNSVAGTKSTQLMDIDRTSGALLLQNPPNDGVLKTVAVIDGLSGPVQGFDIASAAEGTNNAFVLAGGGLYRLDLATAKAMMVGKVGAATMTFIDLAAVPAN